ncbi:MAG: plasmid pRiA4b ORF-3 family protein [Mycobacteriales bacterium]
MRTTRLRITLRDVTPAVMRVLDVPATTTLPELHDLLQVAIGWTDSHLHQFVVGEALYGTPHEEWEDGQHDESEHVLTDLGDRFTYRYDFGDGWEHDVEVLGPGDDVPGLRYGENDCPPEDCGGPGGWEELREVLADPTHEEYEDSAGWAASMLRPFDQATTEDLVRRTIGEVPASVRLVLDLAAGGVTLTPGGRLPRTFVRQVQEQRPAWAYAAKPASIEEDLVPLASLHEALREVGLLRLSKGIVRPTKVAADDAEVVRRLRRRYPEGQFTTYLVTNALALLLARGPLPVEDLGREVFELLGSGWAVGGERLTERQTVSALRRQTPLLRGLDALAAYRGTWEPGPSADRLLPRAVALAAPLS